MCKIIDSELVIGNILIELLEKDIKTIEFEKIIKFEEKLSKKLNKLDYYTTFSIQELSKFEENYSFFITLCHESLVFNPKLFEEKKNGVNRLSRYFRYGIPTVITEQIEHISNEVL